MLYLQELFFMIPWLTKIALTVERPMLKTFLFIYDPRTCSVEVGPVEFLLVHNVEACRL